MATASVVGMLIGLAFVEPKAVEVQVYEKYELFTLYEDGAYQGKTIKGEVVTGCMQGGLCNE